MSEIDKIIEAAKEERRDLAEHIINLNPAHAQLDSDEREALKHRVVAVIEDAQSKYRLVKSGKASESQVYEYMELFGERGSLSYRLADKIRGLSDREDDVLKNANEVEVLRNKKREFAIIKLGNSELKDIHSDKCSVISSWLEALSDAEANYSQFVEVSHQLSNVLVEMIFDESGFREKRPAGKKKTRPRYSHEEIYAYDRKFGYKKSKNDLFISESRIKDSRAHVKSSYTETQIEDDYLGWYMSILEKFMSKIEKEIEQYDHDLLWNKRTLSAEKIEMINKNILKKRKELARLSTERYKAAKERFDTLKSRQSVK